MGLLSRVFGGKRDEQDEEASSPADLPAEAAAPAPQSPSHSGSTYRVPTVAGDLPSDVGAILQPGKDGGQMYNPYAGLQHVPRGNRSFRVSSEPEFVFQEEAAVRRRGFGENLGFYTGTGYLGGAVAGGALGLAQATFLTQPGQPAAPKLQSRRLMLNRVLNSSGQAGRLAGNTLGTLGLLFAVSESLGSGLLDSYAPSSPSWLGTLAAGAFAGGVFRSPRGPKAAVITAAVGTAAAGGLLGLRQVFPGL